MTLKLFLLAFALALVIEGLIPALFPNKWQAYVKKIANESPQSIRSIGIFLVLVGCALLWIIN